ncbi:1-phosphofructokinase family hexose kinase [Clostridium beijerinckii]|uniref:1-phosphofructokinase family hexose kinase n=1 Tax=Clostridium beijerinckii TaxID=1520 RepID=UPI00098C4CD8|nr:1-phosphofructokinase family hexose kinase [Clostridium beijerinckii]NRT77832.1 tagatose 6-phosphate kinase [Clostridium beijerinckii]OOM36332.1 tagatose-6-phosphate kinase [Clostridium beijerinckii]
MILVINLNASLDKKYEIEDIEKGKVMRARSVENTPGGKGLHVANVATILKEDCIATGLLGGKSGEFIENKLKEYGIKQDFVKINGETRSCLAIITDDFTQTEILEPGPEVSDKELHKFLDKYMDLIKNSNVIVASGSVPRNVPTSFYRRLIEMTNTQEKKFLLDTSGELLKEGIKGKPYFIKPNKDEIEALTGRKISSTQEAIEEIKRFQSQGIEFVVISLGAEGSIAGYMGKFYKVSVPNVKAINPVGSGDSYVAGVAVAIQRKYEIEDILKFASACGTANAMEKESGFVTEYVVNELINKIRVEEL